MIWYSHLFKNLPQFVMIHTVKVKQHKVKQLAKQPIICSPRISLSPQDWFLEIDNDILHGRERVKEEMDLFRFSLILSADFPDGLVVKNLPASEGEAGWISGSRRSIPWRRKWQPTPVFLPGESHGQRSLVGYSPWGRKEPDATEHA